MNTNVLSILSLLWLLQSLAVGRPIEEVKELEQVPVLEEESTLAHRGLGAHEIHADHLAEGASHVVPDHPPHGQTQEIESYHSSPADPKGLSKNSSDSDRKKPSKRKKLKKKAKKLWKKLLQWLKAWYNGKSITARMLRATVRYLDPRKLRGSKTQTKDTMDTKDTKDAKVSVEGAEASKSVHDHPPPVDKTAGEEAKSKQSNVTNMPQGKDGKVDPANVHEAPQDNPTEAANASSYQAAQGGKSGHEHENSMHQSVGQSQDSKVTSPSPDKDVQAAAANVHEAPKDKRLDAPGRDLKPGSPEADALQQDKSEAQILNGKATTQGHN